MMNTTTIAQGAALGKMDKVKSTIELVSKLEAENTHLNELLDAKSKILEGKEWRIKELQKERDDLSADFKELVRQRKELKQKLTIATDALKRIQKVDTMQPSALKRTAIKALAEIKEDNDE